MDVLHSLITLINFDYTEVIPIDSSFNLCLLNKLVDSEIF